MRNVWKGMVAGLAGGSRCFLDHEPVSSCVDSHRGRLREAARRTINAAERGSKGDQDADAKEQDDATVETAKVISEESSVMSCRRVKRNLLALRSITPLAL